MNPWIAKAVVLAATVLMMAIRGPHGQRNRRVKVAKSQRTALETGLLVFAWVGFFIPLVWVASPAFSFAKYPLRAVPLAAWCDVLRDRSLAVRPMGIPGHGTFAIYLQGGNDHGLWQL